MARVQQQLAALSQQNPAAEPLTPHSVVYPTYQVTQHAIRGYIRRIVNNRGRDGIQVQLWQGDTLKYVDITGQDHDEKPYGYFEITGITAGDYTVKLRGGGARSDDTFAVSIPGTNEFDDTRPGDGTMGAPAAHTNREERS